MLLKSLLWVAALPFVLCQAQDGQGAQDLVPRATAATTATGPVCTVPAASGDASYVIQNAFKYCGYNKDPTKRGRIVFQNITYTINKVMNTTYLQNVDIDLKGTLSWDNSNISYWLQNSYPTGYQNQSSAWLFGGKNINWQGFGYGTLNGNGQAWYNFVAGQSNYPGRPHQITIRDTSSSTFSGLRFINSQMWTMTITRSKDVLLQDIFVSSTSNNPHIPARNTDGADTMFSDNITFRRWTVINGDDSISAKANSTNILIEDCNFYKGLGIAIGSIGQYNGQYETIQNITARRINLYNIRYGVYLKTWTGTNYGYPPNGGGGGFGFMSNLTFTDFNLDNSAVFSVTQCTSYSGQTGGCDTSQFNIRNIKLANWVGTTNTSTVANIQCSAASPCTNMEIDYNTFQLTNLATNAAPSRFSCHAVKNTIGFSC